MLPETLAPFAEILPSATVRVELAVGSQLPVLVTIVTCHRPSYGVWAAAGADAKLAIAKTNNTLPMRLRRMKQFPELCVMDRLI